MKFYQQNREVSNIKNMCFFGKIYSLRGIKYISICKGYLEVKKEKVCRKYLEERYEIFQ